MKTFSLARIREVFPNFNETPVTEAQLRKVCRKKEARVHILTMPLLVDGYHVRKHGRNYIIINKKLTGDKWLHTALHEYCHFLFDAPDHGDYVFFRRGDGCGDIESDRYLPEEVRRRKKLREKFADAFALAAMVPWPDVERLSREDHSENKRLWLYAARIEAHADFNF